jgi:hypothetical protein
MPIIIVAEDKTSNGNYAQLCAVVVGLAGVEATNRIIH